MYNSIECILIRHKNQGILLISIKLSNYLFLYLRIRMLEQKF